MLKVDHIETSGWEAALRGMRNPMNSWTRSDSAYDEDGNYILGENDLSLALRLAKAGAEHRKYLRMITVTVDITAPLYWVAEHDTYKVGTTRNSCSFMHRGVSKPFTIDDFSVDPRIKYHRSSLQDEKAENTALFELTSTWESVLDELNSLRNEYLETKDDAVFFAIRALLPQGYLTRYTWSANYEVCLNIIRQRKNHRLPEWHEFADALMQLPYMAELVDAVNGGA